MAIKLNDVVKLAKGAHSLPALRSVVFDGQSAITAAQLDWMVGVPCLQPHLTAPVVVPVDVLLKHMAVAKGLIVYPDKLMDEKGLVTPIERAPKVDYASVLDMMPKAPEGKAVQFALDLDALDRVLIAAGKHDIRYYLNGVLFDFSEGFLVGTDGHRLHQYRNRVPRVFKRKVVDGVPQGKDVQMIVPRDPLRFVLSSGSPAAAMSVWGLGVDKVVPQVLIQSGDAFVWVRKPVDGRFPDIQRVIPAKVRRPVWATVDPVALSDAAVAMGKSARLATQGKNNVVVVDFGLGSMGNAHVPAKLQIPFELHTDDGAIDLAVYRDYLEMALCSDCLQDAADCVTQAAQWRFDYQQCGTQGLMVEDGDFLAVVMNAMGYSLRKMPVPLPDVVTVPKEPQEPQEVAENPVSEPCPGAVAAVVAGLVQKAQESAKKAPKKAKKAESVPAEPVAA